VEEVTRPSAYKEFASMMKIGFSSRVCPKWDLETIVRNASAMGFSGVELFGLRGQFDLPRVPALAEQTESVRRLFEESNVELACLSAPIAMDSCSESEVLQQEATLEEYAELALELRCPNVRIGAGRVQPLDNRNAAMSRIGGLLERLVPIAMKSGITMLVENDGDFRNSGDAWFLIDAVGHPAVQCCWNQCRALTVHERATRSIPRLSTKIGMVHMTDASFDGRGALVGYKRLGEGDAEIGRQIELLKGLMYNRYLIFEEPTVGSDPKAVLEPAAKFLRECIEQEPTVLSAYKGDKRAPRMASPTLSSGTG